MVKINVIALLALFMIVQYAYCQSFMYKSADHYNDRVLEFNGMCDIDSADIVMLGNSLTEYAGDWNKLLKWKHIRNRGIAGDDAFGIYHRLNKILEGKPKAIFLMVGINDQCHDLSPTQVAELCEKVVAKINLESPTTKLFVESLLPINETFKVWTKLNGKTNDVPQINRLLVKYCKRHRITFINLFPKFVRHGCNELRKDMTVDGLHLNAFGYKVWAFEMHKYLMEIK